MQESRNLNSLFFIHNSMRKGFTIIELILVISIISILVVAYSSLGASFVTRNATENTLNELVSSLRIAQLNTFSSKNNSVWGVRVDSNQITLFSGDTYAARDTIYDEYYTVPSSIIIAPSGVDIIFEALTGDTPAHSFVVSNNLGGSNTVSVNEIGVVDVN